MALATREIPREQWRAYFDDFSRNHEPDELLADLEVLGLEVGAQVEAQRPRLAGISYDDKDDVLVIGLDAPGGTPEDLEHLVYEPQKIMVAEGDGEMVFDIEDAERTQTLLRLNAGG
ncbi:MAG TPA: DUF5335 family protein [Solirubrobacteraceae bacterium]